MSDVVHYQDFDELMSILDKSPLKYNKRKIRKAYEFANLAHGDQRRVSGVPFILHPTSVACILADMGMDTDSIIAALLHDTVEDTDVTLKDVEEKFGESVARLVDGLTKISKIVYTDREEQQAENVRKMLIAMSNDIRVIIVKLADRLHNMRTIECVAEQKRRDKAAECIEVYAPIAHRLGMKALKDELEDLSLRYLDPIAYEEIEQELNLTEKERNAFIEEIKRKILDKIGNSIPKVTISGRVKSIVSIYRKTYMQGKEMNQIFDVFAVRVVVNTIADCYNVLGIVHDIFTPIPSRFKDYISTPKSNMYQSLHTTVFDKRSIPFEVQIRTYEMHQTAEYGIAAHWKYKLKMKSGAKEDSLEERLAWIRRMLEAQSDAEDKTDIVKSIKYDLSSYEVYVFTPKGDVIQLPYGATAIDMAYAIHSGVGNRMIGAKANNRIVPIDYVLQNGDIIEIITQKEGTGPKRDWLKIVKTNSARTKIRQWFKKEKREENIVEGRTLFMQELKKGGMQFAEEDLDECLKPIYQRHYCATLDDFYAAIGYGGIQLWKIMPRVKEIYQKKYKKTDEEVKPITEAPLPTRRRKVGSGVVIEGVDDCLIKFARCCNPLPGDEIIGYITRGFGVSVHKRDCTNVPKDIAASEEPKRWVNAHWEDEIHESFLSTLEIVCNDRTGFLADVTKELSNMRIFITMLNSRELKNNQAIVTVTIEINSMDHLRSVMSHLAQINGIVSITRV